MRDRLHGDFHRTGAGRWCKDCQKWVLETEWQEHKHHGPYRISNERLEELKE